MQRLAFRSFDAVVAVSRPLAESLAASGVRRDRIHLVPNAYIETVRPMDRTAARRELGVPDDPFIVGWVGRLSREKGGDVLVEAVARLSDVALKVSVFGDGPELEPLRIRAAALGLNERITWHGVVHEAASFFRAFDVFVLSSRTEGSPIVLFEAMAAGVPIIATQVGGVPDVVSPTQALLVPSEDPAALAAGLLSVYRDPGRAVVRARAARERLLTEFQPGPWLARYEALYRQIQRPGPRGTS
jgi:glycosyltransferase involved in cell wall biosynthesis